MPSRSSSHPFRYTRVLRIVLVLALAAYGIYTAQQQKPQLAPNHPAEVESVGNEVVVKDVAIRTEEEGEIRTWRGDVDLTQTVARIRNGKRIDRWEHDGDPFGNHEQRLPERPRGYYHEWVHPTPWASGPGPPRHLRRERRFVVLARPL